MKDVFVEVEQSAEAFHRNLVRHSELLSLSLA